MKLINTCVFSTLITQVLGQNGMSHQACSVNQVGLDLIHKGVSKMFDQYLERWNVEEPLAPSNPQQRMKTQHSSKLYN